jgi:phosphoribosylformylglycinamidine cyclo-ligase
MKRSPDDVLPELGTTLGAALLAPTRLYPRHVRAMLSAVDVRAMCHVTGGGLPGNLPRVLPDGLGVHVTSRWPRPPIFDLIARGGPVEEHEMRRTFNLGVGFVFVVPERDRPKAIDALRAEGEAAFELGRVVRVPHDRPFEERVEWPAGQG